MSLCLSRAPRFPVGIYGGIPARRLKETVRCDALPTLDDARKQDGRATSGEVPRSDAKAFGRVAGSCEQQEKESADEKITLFFSNPSNSRCGCCSVVGRTAARNYKTSFILYVEPPIYGCCQRRRRRRRGVTSTLGLAARQDPNIPERKPEVKNPYIEKPFK